MTILSQEQRAASLEAMTSQKFDVLVIGGGVTGAGIALDGRVAWPEHRRHRGPGLGVRHLIAFVAAGAWRAPLPLQPRLQTGGRGPPGTRPAADHDRPRTSSRRSPSCGR